MVTSTEVSNDTQIIEPDTGYHGLERVNSREQKEDYIVGLCSLDFNYDPDINRYNIHIPNRSHDPGELKDRVALCDKRFTTSLFTEIGDNALVQYGRVMHRRKQFDLLLKNVRQQLDRSGDSKMIRLQKQGDNFVARALVSPRFKRMDVDELIPLIERCLKGANMRALGGRNTQGGVIVARWVSNEPIFSHNDRNIFIGFQLRTSDIGESALYFEPFGCDGFCDNGMVFGKKALDLKPLYIKHSGKNITLRGFIPQQRIPYADSYKIEKYIRASLSPGRMEMMKVLLDDSFKRTFDKDAELVIQRIGRYYDLTNEEITIAKEEFIEGENHAYGIQAAFTATAQKVETFERRERIERECGGKILEQPKELWEKLVLAA